MRLTKTNGEKTINYINDGMYVSGEVSGESIVKYTYGRSLISIDNNGTMGYYHTDEHGNVRKVTDSKGNTAASYEYDAFGQETGTAADYYNPMRYCGEYRDEETGLIYLRARYYDSVIGRFISEDPHWNTDNMIYGDKEYEEDEIKVPDAQAISQASNLYVYGLNNPILYVDSNGKTVWMINANLAAQCGLRLSASTGVIWDDQGNIGIVDTGSIGAGIFGASAGGAYAEINAPTIENIQGASIEFGGGGSIGVVGGSADITLSLGDRMYDGAIYSAGFSLGSSFDAHAQISYSNVTSSAIGIILRVLGVLTFL